MCAINAVINGHKWQLFPMREATKRRGISSSIEQIGNAFVAFDLLPITDESISPGSFRYGDTIVFMNGFISNYKELAEKYSIDLETNCDTELLVKFIDQFGETKLQELNGFFGVLYYCERKQMWAAFTDRYGIKQLYEYVDEKGTRFISSEVKGILAAVSDIKLSERGVNHWKSNLGVMNPHTIYEGIKRVAKLPFIVPEKIEIDYTDAKLKLIDLLSKSMMRNQYDGKTGVYLSGGVDSGFIANWMYPDYSFSVDYVDERFSESDLIKKNSVGYHVSLMCNEALAEEYAAKTMLALDDLKAGSCYTNFAIAELASKFVRVVYSGAGGDEFFGGYPHRKNKYIGDVIQRTGHGEFDWRDEISHFEYDLKFLDAILVVEDRMSGWHTMETRYPLLDNDLVDFALSLPDEYLENKRILKDISGLHPDVINGPKKGFSNPYFSNDGWVNFTLKNLKYGGK